MRQVRQTRVAQEDSQGTFGTWVVDGQPICVTLEPDWEENGVGISCIPAKKYKVVRHHSPTYGECWKVLNVPNRSNILIHILNWDHETEGCIGLGEKFAKDSQGRWMISNSADAINEFMRIMEGTNEFDLTIVEAF